MLLAARDQIGVKPLYYTVAGGAFVAASELRTLIAHPAVRPELDPAAVVEYLSFGFVAGTGTLLDGIFKLQPGHSLRVAGRRCTHRRVLGRALGRADDQPNGRRDSLEELRQTLDAAVSGSLVSDVPVSLMLSGGLDSSAIAALGHEPCVRRRFDRLLGLVRSRDGRIDCRSPSRGDLGIRHREILLTEESLAERLRQLARRHGSPLGEPDLDRRVVHRCGGGRRTGTRSCSAGDGADELFGGYNRWMTYLRFHDRYWSAPACDRASRDRTWDASVSHEVSPATSRAERATEGSCSSAAGRSTMTISVATSGLSHGKRLARGRPSLTSTLFASGSTTRRPGGDQLAWMSYVALKTDLVEDYLVRLDTMGMRHSVEGRVPLLDVDLVELAFSLSQRAKVGPHYEQKALYRQAVSSFLPTYITDRPKQGFCPPVADWASSLLRSRVGDQLDSLTEGLIAPDAVETLPHGDR